MPSEIERLGQQLLSLLEAENNALSDAVADALSLPLWMSRPRLATLARRVAAASNDDVLVQAACELAAACAAQTKPAFYQRLDTLIADLRASDHTALADMVQSALAGATGGEIRGALVSALQAVSVAGTPPLCRREAAALLAVMNTDAG